MLKRNQDGMLGVTGLLLIVTILLLIGALSFGFWAYTGRQDYKNNVDQKVAYAVAAAQNQQQTKDNQAFAEAEKSPLKTYNGPSSYGSLVVNFPRTWSGYVDDSGSGQALVDGYFYPGVVPQLAGQTPMALRVQVLNQSYASVVANMNNQGNKFTAVAYSLPKVPKVVGIEGTGSINGTQTGTIVVLPLRDTTLEIWTEGSQFLNDFNTYILPNFSFAP